jgi:membrane-anchored mycosin MYCP
MVHVQYVLSVPTCAEVPVTRLLATRVRRWSLVSFTVGLLAAVAAQGAPALAQPAEEYVKFYTVRSATSGRAETLSTIASRLLGDPFRSDDIFNLNAGRKQPDGDALGVPGRLKPGWHLVVPWDARGDGIRIGLLPTGSATAPAPIPSEPTSPASPDPSAGDPGTGGQGSGGTGCGPLGSGPVTALPWAQLRLSPDRAWTRGKGEGVTVAVLDTGVAATVPALAGRVLPGTDLTGRGGRADDDCVGHGTAMAGIVAASASGETRFVGMAPQARILPLRVTTGGPVDGGRLGTALEAATAAGASVLMLGAVVDLDDRSVSAAIDAAIARGAVVVVPVGRNTTPRTGRDGLLRVGAAGTDDRPAEKYPPGVVDVLAPGVNVASLSVNPTAQVTGTGADFAVPFVAGLAALVRSVYPQQTPAQVADTIRRTAGGGGRSTPDAVAGWGVIDPGAAVGVTVRRDTGSTRSQPVWNGGQGTALLFGLAIVGVLAFVLRRFGPLRRRPRTDHRGNAG